MNEYFKFCKIREESIKNDIIDLSQHNFFYPTCMLPLGNFLKENISMDYIPPTDDVANYISIIMNSEYSDGSTYVPIVNLPKDHNQANEIIKHIYDLHNCGKDYGGINAFNYLIGELVDNIYTHSEFSNANVMAQKYLKKKFVEISFFDDGISIPACFEKNGIYLNDCDAITEAINGKSTKSSERGYGLNTSINLYVNGIGGELLLVSRNCLLYKNKKEQKLYRLERQYRLSGTLISIRVPYPTSEVDIYAYIT